MLIMLFAVFWRVLPSGGRGETVDVLGIPVSFLTWDGLSHLFLPALNVAIYKISLVIRLTRAGTAEVGLQDYVKYARARGLPEHRVINVHILKNILIPVVTVVGPVQSNENDPDPCAIASRIPCSVHGKSRRMVTV